MPDGFPVHIIPRIAEILAASAREGVRVLYDTCAASNMASSDFPLQLYAESNVYFTGATSSASVRGGGVGCCTIHGGAANLAVTDVHVVDTLPSGTLLLSGSWVRNALGPLRHRHLSFHNDAITLWVPQQSELQRASFVLDYVHGLLQFLNVTVTAGVDASMMPLAAAGYAVEGASAQGATEASTTSASFMVHVANVDEHAAAEPAEDAAVGMSIDAPVTAAAEPLPPNSPITPLSYDSDELPSATGVLKSPIETDADAMLLDAPAPHDDLPPWIADDELDLVAAVAAIDEACAAALRPQFDACASTLMAATAVPFLHLSGVDSSHRCTAKRGTDQLLHSACRFRALVDGNAQELSEDDDSDDSTVDSAAEGASTATGDVDPYWLIRRRCIRRAVKTARKRVRRLVQNAMQTPSSPVQSDTSDSSLPDLIYTTCDESAASTTSVADQSSVAELSSMLSDPAQVSATEADIATCLDGAVCLVRSELERANAAAPTTHSAVNVRCVSCGGDDDRELMLRCHRQQCVGTGARGLHRHCGQPGSMLVGGVDGQWYCAECVGGMMSAALDVVLDRNQVPLECDRAVFMVATEPVTPVPAPQRPPSFHGAGLTRISVPGGLFDPVVTSLVQTIAIFVDATSVTPVGHALTVSQHFPWACTYRERVPHRSEAGADRVSDPDMLTLGSVVVRSPLVPTEDTPVIVNCVAQYAAGRPDETCRHDNGLARIRYLQSCLTCIGRIETPSITSIAFPAYANSGFDMTTPPELRLPWSPQQHYDTLLNLFAYEHRHLHVYVVSTSVESGGAQRQQPAALSSEPPACAEVGRPRVLLTDASTRFEGGFQQEGVERGVEVHRVSPYAPAQPCSVFVVERRHVSPPGSRLQSSASSSLHTRDRSNSQREDMRASGSQTTQRTVPVRGRNSPVRGRSSPVRGRDLTAARPEPVMRLCRYGERCRDRTTQRGCRFQHPPVQMAIEMYTAEMVRARFPVIFTPSAAVRALPFRAYTGLLPAITQLSHLPIVFGQPPDVNPLAAADNFLQLYQPPQPRVGPVSPQERVIIVMEHFAGSFPYGHAAMRNPHLFRYVAFELHDEHDHRVQAMLRYCNAGGVVRMLYFQCVDGRLPTLAAVAERVYEVWHVGLEQVRFIAGSPECATLSTGTAEHDLPARGGPPDYRALTTRARFDDESRQEFFDFADQVLQYIAIPGGRTPKCTIVGENPKFSYFTLVPDVRRRILFGGYVEHRVDYCLLSGIPWSQKPTVLVTKGPLLSINLCCTEESPCQHRLPDGSAHLVGIAGYNVNRDQVRVQEGDLRRAAIPVELCAVLLAGALLAQDLNEQREMQERERHRLQGRAGTVRNPEVSDSGHNIADRFNLSRPMSSLQPLRAEHARAPSPTRAAQRVNRAHQPASSIGARICPTAASDAQAPASPTRSRTSTADALRYRSPSQSAREPARSSDGTQSRSANPSPRRIHFADEQRPQSRAPLSGRPPVRYRSESMSPGVSAHRSPRTSVSPPARRLESDAGPSEPAVPCTQIDVRTGVSYADVYATNRLAFYLEPHPDAEILHKSTAHTSVKQLLSSVHRWKGFAMRGAHGHLIEAAKITERDLWFEGVCDSCMGANLNASPTRHTHHQRDARDRLRAQSQSPGASTSAGAPVSRR